MQKVLHWMSISGMSVFFLVVILSGIRCDEDCYSTIKDESLIGDLAEKIGSANLVVCYKFMKVKCNESYSPSLVDKRPTSIFGNIKDKCPLATVIFYANHLNSSSANLLWLVSNVDTGDFKNGFYGQSGNEQVIYSTPQNDGESSVHIFLVACQKEYIDCPMCSVESRSNFKVSDFFISNKLYSIPEALHFKLTATGQLMKNTTYMKEFQEGNCSE